jgi:7-cyano-7-deazaguanine synthase in queuosine biosynthesis
MKLLLGPENLQCEFEFTIWKQYGNLTIVNGYLKKVNRIGLYLSGGLDSAALLCLILTELKTINKLDTPITCFTVNKTDCFNQYSKNVLREVQKHFEIDHIKHVIFDNDQVTKQWLNPRNEIGPKAIKYVADYHKNMQVYMACNRMAPEEYIKYTTPMLTDHGTRINGILYCSPFLFLHKPQMLDIFFKLNVEHIINYCHSCVIQEEGQCGKCYSCEERAWGFKMLDKQDPAIS